MTRFSRLLIFLPLLTVGFFVLPLNAATSIEAVADLQSDPREVGRTEAFQLTYSPALRPWGQPLAGGTRALLALSQSAAPMVAFRFRPSRRMVPAFDFEARVLDEAAVAAQCLLGSFRFADLIPGLKPMPFDLVALVLDVGPNFTLRSSRPETLGGVLGARFSF